METKQKYQAAIETQSYGHYTEFSRCAHRHGSIDSARACADRWFRRENKIAIEQGLADNGARFVVVDAQGA